MSIKPPASEGLLAPSVPRNLRSGYGSGYSCIRGREQSPVVQRGLSGRILRDTPA
jgi:hypothetical protein